LGRVVPMEQTSAEVETAFSRSPYEPTMAMEETEDAVNDAPHLHSACCTVIFWNLEGRPKFNQSAFCYAPILKI
jgi:hypothetical protein